MNWLVKSGTMTVTLCVLGSVGWSAPAVGTAPSRPLSALQVHTPLAQRPETPPAKACEETTATDAALLEAAQQGAISEVQALLDCGYNPDALARWQEDFTSGESASEESASESMDESGNDTDNDTDNNTVGQLLATPLHAAAWQGHTEVVALLIEAGADVNKLDEWELSVLMTAAEQNHVAVVQQIIEAGAAVNYIATCADCIDETALTIAASRGYAEVVTMLLDAGADPEHRERFGRTALDLAMENEYPRVVEVLRSGT